MNVNILYIAIYSVIQRLTLKTICSNNEKLSFTYIFIFYTSKSTMNLKNYQGKLYVDKKYKYVLFVNFYIKQKTCW